ncbi:hypothetical protein RCH21_002531 [Arthrobacter sp. PL16]|nr:hypothetical protein [Arthrobacter sp. PL16]
MQQDKSASVLGPLVGDAENLRENLLASIKAFSDNVRDIFTQYKIEDRIEELEESNLLLLVLQRFAEVDLHPAPQDHVRHLDWRRARPPGRAGGVRTDMR